MAFITKNKKDIKNSFKDKADLTQTMIIIAGLGTAAIVAIGGVSSVVMEKGETTANCIANYNGFNAASGSFVMSESEFEIKGNELIVSQPVENTASNVENNMCGKDERTSESFTIQLITAESANRENSVHFTDRINIQVKDDNGNRSNYRFDVKHNYDFSKYDGLGFDKIHNDGISVGGTTQDSNYYGIIVKPDGSKEVEKFTGDYDKYLRHKGSADNYSDPDSLNNKFKTIRDNGVQIHTYNVIHINNWVYRNPAQTKTAENFMYGTEISLAK